MTPSKIVPPPDPPVVGTLPAPVPSPSAPPGSGKPATDFALDLASMSETNLRGWFAAQSLAAWYPHVRNIQHPIHGTYPDPAVVARVSLKMGEFMRAEFRRWQYADEHGIVINPLMEED
jgi:hypothetical protein